MYKDWFKYWFNSQHYLLLYQNRNEKEAELFYELIQSNVPLKKNWKVIDFCCGYGRLAKKFAENGFDITGIDLSKFLIEKAIKTFKEQKLVGEFKVCDVRNFKERELYNLGVNFFTSFGYFSDEENEITLNNFCKSIVKDGWIVFDYFNPDYIIKNLVTDEKFHYENLEIIINKKIENNRINKIILIKSGNNSELYSESVKIYSLKDFERMFAKNNYIIKKIFGDYNGLPFDSASPRIIIFAKRA